MRSKRSQSFKIILKWINDKEDSSVDYSLEITEGPERTPVIKSEVLTLSLQGNPQGIITTTRKGERRLLASDGTELTPFTFRDRLVLGTAYSREGTDPIGSHLAALREFWSRAVFLRLSPNEMSKPASSSRASYEPILDESGRGLPALLRGMKPRQLLEVINAISRVLPDFNAVEVSGPNLPQGDIYYSLGETMPSPGARGRKERFLPAWMLSEGTRRITAILTLLRNEPVPSFLCIEEIENGLDPWTVVEIIKELRSASDRGTQIAVTTHSPWLLDHVKYEDVIYVERQEGETVYTRFADRSEVKAYMNRVPPGAVYTTEG
jgi:predicted ATPase